MMKTRSPSKYCSQREVCSNKREHTVFKDDENYYPPMKDKSSYKDDLTLGPFPGAYPVSC